jgi:hypothetical protein
MKQQENGGSCTIRRFVFCTHPPIIIRQIKSKRVRWAGHVACMGEERNVYRVLVESLEERDHLKDQGVDGRIGSEWILERLAGGV